MVGLFLQNMSDPFAKHEAGQSYLDFHKLGGEDAFNTLGFIAHAGTSEYAQEVSDRIAYQKEEDEKTKDALTAYGEGVERAQALIEQVSYSNGQFHMFGKSINEEDMDAQVDETLKNIDSIADRHNLNGQDKVELTTLLMAYQQAEAPQEKAEILTKIAKQQSEIAYEISEKAFEKQEVRKQSELTNDERQDENISSLDSAEEREIFAIKIVQDTDSIEIAEVSRGAISLGNENPFADTRNVSVAFNASASGIEVAEITPQNMTEAQINAPILSNG